MKLYLVRHGESFANKHGIVQGHLDVDLTDEGYEQAEKLGDRFGEQYFDKVYASDLRRALNTAKAATKHTKQEITVDKKLRERSKGVEEGKNMSKMTETEYHDFHWDVNSKYEEGESVVDHMFRCGEFIDEFLENHDKGEEILIVSHGGTIKGILESLFNTTPEELQRKFDEKKHFRTSNTCVYIVNLNDPNNPIIELENCTKHLK